MKPSPGSLSLRTAWKIAWRDLRASWVKFAFVIVAVALGVGSLTGMRSFSSVFQETLLDQARTIMAADLSARDFQRYTPKQIAELKVLRIKGVSSTLVTDTVSMASTEESEDPLLVSLKAVDPAQYPYYGHVLLASGKALGQVLTDNTAIVSREFLLRTGSRVGDMLHLGNSTFRIDDVVRSEPDRISSTFGIGPRVMITQAALPATGLVGYGSRASERTLFRLPPRGSRERRAMNVDDLHKLVARMFPEAQVTDFREANPALVTGLHHSTAMLTLVSLVTLVLSAIGVAMAMHAHLQQRLETIAIMKALGARSSQVIRIYALQTLFLGIAGGIVGIVAGSAVARIFPLLLARLISLPLVGRLALGPVLVGLLTGILTTVLFTLPPLLQIREFRPLHILRRNVEQDPNARAGRLMPRNWVGVTTILVILAGMAAIASTLTESAMIGGWFAGGLLAVLIFLLLVASGLLKSLRWALSRFRSRLAPVVRQGLANLYRPGNQSAAVLTALGVGVMLIMTVYCVQRAIVNDLHVTGSDKEPNVFLVDIATTEMPGVKKLVESQPSVHGTFESAPLISARILAIDGVPTEKLATEHYPKHLLRSTSVTWADHLPTGEQVRSGRWWSEDAADPVVAVSEGTAKRLHLKLGSSITFHVSGKTLSAKVVALYRSDGEHIYTRSRFILPSRALAGVPAVWYGAFHADPSRIGDVERTLFHAYPTITIINVADVLATIRKVVDQIALIIRFLAGFAMLAGGIILASSVIATRLQRVREVAILKSLGALRRQIVSMMSIEFLLLGGIAGAAGVLFALALSAILLNKLHVAFHPGWAAMLGAVVATAVLSAIVGWLASSRMLNQKPLQVLREE